MGVNGSTELPKHFHDITKWPKSKVESAVKAYIDGEYDFGIDYTVVMNITGCDTDASKELVKAHSKNSSGMYVQLYCLLLCACSTVDANKLSNFQLSNFPLFLTFCFQYIIVIITTFIAHNNTNTM